MTEGNNFNFFNEEKARRLVKYLLEKDIKSYKKLIPEIESLDSEKFKKLFQGVEYNYSIFNKKDFDDLSNKFNNFYKILEEYYEDDKYYPYIEDLWLNNIFIEDLDKINYVNVLKSFKVKYEEWPEDFKKKFQQLMNGTKNTKYKELKNKFETEYATYRQLIKDLKKLEIKIEEKPENESYLASTSTILDTLMFSILPFLLDCNSINIVNELNLCKINTMYKEFDNTYIQIAKELKDYCSYYNVRKPCSPCDVLNEFKNIISEDLCDKSVYFDLNNIGEGWKILDENSRYDFNCDSILVKIKKEITHPYPNLTEKMQNIVTNKYTSLIILAMSFINLLKSICTMQEINKELEKLENGEYDEEFKKIQNDFNLYKDKIKYLPDRIEDAINFIQELYYKISNVRERLMNHIKSIKESIKKTKKLKSKSIFGMLSSGFFGLTSLSMFILSANVKNVFSAVTNFASITTNLTSGTISYTNYKKCKDIIKQLEEKSKRAIELSEEMNKLIKTLINELKMRKEGIPKFVHKKK